MNFVKIAVVVVAAAAIVGTAILSTSTALADLYGDINRDGEVNAGDATELLQYSAWRGAGNEGDLATFVGGGGSAQSELWSQLPDTFWFSSGVGGWATSLSIAADGSFSGRYSDSNLGESGPGYGGTVYQCEFSGSFTAPIKIDDYTYACRIASMTYADEVGTSYIENNTLFCNTDVYGLENAETIYVYLPGKPVNGLSESFIDWVRPSGTKLEYGEVMPEGSYGIFNETQGEGFYGEK